MPTDRQGELRLRAAQTLGQAREQGRVADLGFEPGPATRPHHSARPRVTAEDSDGQRGGDADSGLVRGRDRTPRGGSGLNSSPPSQQLSWQAPCGPRGRQHPQSSFPPPIAPPGGGTHRDHTLEADVEVLSLVGFQLLEGESGLTDKLVMAKFVLITDRDPAIPRKGEGRKGAVRDAGHECVMCMVALLFPICGAQGQACVSFLKTEY